MPGMSPPWDGDTPEAGPGSSHRCSQGPDEETGSRRRGLQDLAAQTLRSPGSFKVHPLGMAAAPPRPATSGEPPAPCPFRQDLSPLPGCHHGG